MEQYKGKSQEKLKSELSDLMEEQEFLKDEISDIDIKKEYDDNQEKIDFINSMITDSVSSEPVEEEGEIEQIEKIEEPLEDDVPFPPFPDYLFYADGGMTKKEDINFALGGYLASAGIGAYYGAKNPKSVKKVTDPIDKAISQIGKNLTDKKYAKGGTVKGRNNKTGESFGVVIGSKKFTNDDKDKIQLNVRIGYGSRISEYKLIFDKKGNLQEITDYGYSLDGYPSTSSGSGKKISAQSKSESINALKELNFPQSFSKRVIDFVSEKDFAKGGATEKDQQTIIQEGTEIEYVSEDGDYSAIIGYQEFFGRNKYYIWFNGIMVHSSITYKSMLRKLNQLKKDYKLEYEGIIYAKGGVTVGLYDEGQKSIRFQQFDDREETKKFLEKEGMKEVKKDPKTRKEFKFYAKGGKVKFDDSPMMKKLWNERGYDVPYLESLSDAELKGIYETEFDDERTYDFRTDRDEIPNDYAKGGMISDLIVGNKVGHLRPNTGRYEYSEISEINGSEVKLVHRHPKKRYWDNYFEMDKDQIEEFINTPSKDFNDGRPLMKIKKVYAKGGKTTQRKYYTYDIVGDKVHIYQQDKEDENSFDSIEQIITQLKKEGHKEKDFVVLKKDGRFAKGGEIELGEISKADLVSHWNSGKKYNYKGEDYLVSKLAGARNDFFFQKNGEEYFLILDENNGKYFPSGLYAEGGEVLTAQYKEYLDNLRDSGETNMLGAGRYLQQEFGLDKREARKILAEWMGSYEKGGVTDNLEKYYKEQKNEIEKIKNYGKGEYTVAWLLTPNGSKEYADLEANSWKEAVDIVKKGEKEDGFDITNVEVGVDTPNEYLGRFPIEHIINPNDYYPTFAKGGEVITDSFGDKYELREDEEININDYVYFGDTGDISVVEDEEDLEFARAGKTKAIPYAKGGETASPITNYHKNFMGTLSFDLKVKGMRKPQDFIVYPITGKTNIIRIQSDKKWGEIDATTGKGILSKTGNNSWAFALDVSNRNVNKFELSDEELEELKNKIRETSGKEVGNAIITTDNSGAELLADGGVLNMDEVSIYQGADDNYTIVMSGDVYDMNSFSMPNTSINTYIGDRRDYPSDISHWGKKIKYDNAPMVIKEKIDMRKEEFEHGGKIHNDKEDDIQMLKDMISEEKDDDIKKELKKELEKLKTN